MNISQILGAPQTLPSGTVLSNRLAKAAMSETLGTSLGDPSERLIRLYEKFGAGGAGMLITGNVMVQKNGAGEPGNVIFREDSPEARFREWAAAGQRSGSPMFMQINHAGRQTPRFVNPKPVAPSAVPMAVPGVFAAPRALEDAEIVEIITLFGATAAFAQRTGFSGVQLHGAHGYLISQFLSPLSNVRTDRWGGSLENRMRFLIETYRSVRKAVGPQFPVGLKLNSADFLRGGITIEESALVAQTIAEEGMDFIEVSGGTYEKPAMVFAKASTAEREAHFLEYAEKMRAVVKRPLMLTGGLRTPEVMAKIVADGVVDLIGMARPIALEPNLPREILGGRTLTSASKRVEGKGGMFAAAKDLSFYTAQLHRMGNGLDPELKMSPWRALGSAALGMFKRAERT